MTLTTLEAFLKARCALSILSDQIRQYPPHSAEALTLNSAWVHLSAVKGFLADSLSADEIQSLRDSEDPEFTWLPVTE